MINKNFSPPHSNISPPSNIPSNNDPSDMLGSKIKDCLKETVNKYISIDNCMKEKKKELATLRKLSKQCENTILEIMNIIDMPLLNYENKMICKKERVSQNKPKSDEIIKNFVNKINDAIKINGIEMKLDYNNIIEDSISEIKSFKPENKKIILEIKDETDFEIN